MIAVAETRTGIEVKRFVKKSLKFDDDSR